MLNRSFNFFIFLILGCYGALFELISGPKEIIIDDEQIKIHHSGEKYSIKHYYITGETLTHEYKSIEIGGDNSRENVAKLLEKNDKFKIYYFEKLNRIYTVEVYE